MKTITKAVMIRTDNCGIVDTWQSRMCNAAQLARVNRLFRAGEIQRLEPIAGWGDLTHYGRACGQEFHLKVEEVG